jgi:hypothetical protein
MNKNISMFCLTLKPEHEKMIKDLSYIPVGLGDKKFSKECISDKIGFNISDRNPFYGEYTFHYWIWKNYLNEIKTPWVGFCQYRKFFLKKNMVDKEISFKTLKDSVIKNIEITNKNFNCILGKKFSVKDFKLSKIIKHHLTYFISKPNLFFRKNDRNLKVNFDLFHGKGNLDLALEFLDKENKKEFLHYMNNETSFHPHNMFICKTEILKNYYDIVFPWLKKCEAVFGFNNLGRYGQKRIYGFLAERFLSFWFSKNFNVKEVLIVGKDLSDYKNL